MKKFLFCWGLCLLLSAPVRAQGICQLGQCFSAGVNGNDFKFRDYWPLTTLLYRQQESMDGRIPGRTVISIYFSGLSYIGTDGKQFNENVQFEIMYDEREKPGEPSVYTVSLQYQSGLYSIIKGRGALIITGIYWEPDHRSFHLSADVECMMHKWGAPMDGKEDVCLEAELSNVLISVPAWVAVSQK